MESTQPAGGWRPSCGCAGFVLVIVLLAVATALVPTAVMHTAPERLPKSVLRWRNGGGFEIARGAVGEHPWVVHAARRRQPRHATCAYVLLDSEADRSRAIQSEDPLRAHRVKESVSCGLAETADGSGFVGAVGGVGFSRYQIPGTKEWLLFGVLPANVRTVTVAARGRRVTVDTFTNPEYAERFFVIQQAGFGPGTSSAEPATITGMVDTDGKRIRVYWS